MKELHLQLDDETYGYLEIMAGEAKCPVADVAEVAIWAAIGGWLAEKAETKGEGVSVQEQAVPALSKDDGSVAGG